MSTTQWEIQDGFEFKRISSKPKPNKQPSTNNKPQIKSAIRFKTDENAFKKRRHTVSWVSTTKPPLATSNSMENNGVVAIVGKEPEEEQQARDNKQAEELQHPENITQPKRKSSRRSSLSRGKRLSGSLNGLLLLPHATISPSDYYRHIDASLSDPVRMRQLLVWCTQKAMQIVRKDDDEIEKNVKEVVKKVQGLVIDGLIQKQTNVSWYKRDSIQPPTTHKPEKKPNPQNSYNLEKINQLQKSLDKIAQQEIQWKTTLQNMTSQHAQIIDECTHLNNLATSPNAHQQAIAYVSLDPAKIEFLENRRKDDLGLWLREVFVGIQKEVYRLNCNISKSIAFDEAVTRKFGDTITGEIIRAYSRKSSSRELEGIELLGLLSSE